MGVHPGYWGSEGQRQRQEARDLERAGKDLATELSAKRWAYSWRRYTIRIDHRHLGGQGKYVVQDWNEVEWETFAGAKLRCQGRAHSRHIGWMSAALRCLALDLANVVLSVPMAIRALLKGYQEREPSSLSPKR